MMSVTPLPERVEAIISTCFSVCSWSNWPFTWPKPMPRGLYRRVISSSLAKRAPLRIVRDMGLRLVAQPEDETDDVRGEAARLIAVNVQRVVEFQYLIEQHHRHADEEFEEGRGNGEQHDDEDRAREDHHDRHQQQPGERGNKRATSPGSWRSRSARTGSPVRG